MGSSILQAILGGVAGGASGITEVREARRLEEERKRQAERQARADRLVYLGAGFVPEAQAGRMDMPGATPRTPFMAETLPSGERMVMEQSPTERAHQATMREYTQKRGMERAEAERNQATIDAAFASLPPEQQEKIRPLLAMGRAGVASNLIQQVMTPERRKLEIRGGQIIDIEAGTATPIRGYREAPSGGQGPTRTQVVETDQGLFSYNPVTREIQPLMAGETPLTRTRSSGSFISNILGGPKTTPAPASPRQPASLGSPGVNPLRPPLESIFGRR